MGCLDAWGKGARIVEMAVRHWQDVGNQGTGWRYVGKSILSGLTC